MNYTIASSAYEKGGNYVIKSFDRPGNQLTVQISPAEGQATRVEVGVEPGQNDEIRQQVVRVIDLEIRR